VAYGGQLGCRTKLGGVDCRESDFHLMKTTKMLGLALITLGLSASPALFAGQEELAAAIQQSRTETILTHNELVANLKALDALVNQKEGDLRPAFTAFKAGLTVTREASARTVKRAALLKQDGDKYFATWKAEVAEIKDAAIKERAMKRLDGTNKGWNAVSASLQEATVQFPALLGYLSDIEKALNYDLTPDGVKSVRGASRSAVDSFGKIQGQVKNAVAELEKMSEDMSSMIKS
jgi:hypothetical protein